MPVLIDANVLLFSASPASPDYKVARDAVHRLLVSGELLYIVPQSIYEFWAVATRPLNVRGLGLTPTQALAEVTRIRSLFRLLPDIPAIYPEWEKLVSQHGVSGKNAHDTRYVAAMTVHGLTQLLTFNGSDFKRFQQISIIEPPSVLPPSPQSPQTQT